jgi:transposase
MAAFWVAVISKEVFVEVHLLKKHGFSLRQIAKEVGCAVNTVRRQLAEEGTPKYERKVQRPTKLAAYEVYLRARQESAKPLWIPATVLLREIKERGYLGGQTQLRAFLRTLKPTQAIDPVLRFETAPGEQLQMDWVEFRKGANPLYAFCATLGYSRASYVEFVTDMKVQTLVACHERAFEAFGGVPRRVLYDNMKTVVLERDSHGEGQHRYHAAFLDYAKHCGFVIKLCRPYRAKTKGKVERFNGYLRRSFYVPLVSRLKQAGLQLDVVTANIEVARWLAEVANERVHGTTGVRPSDRLRQERPHLQLIPAPWRADIAAARPLGMQIMAVTGAPATPVRPATVAQHMAQEVPMQHPLAVYEQLLCQITQGAAA